MKRLRSFWQHGGSLRRDPADNLPSGSSFLIVTEGSKTEPNYFKALRDRLRLVAADVDIEHPEGTDPIVLTQHAITRRDERRAQAARGAAVEYDEVWVVFDLEKTHDQRRRQAQQAVSLGEASGIRFARSDPSFEYWLLLHVEYTTASFTKCSQVIARLKPHWNGYSKGSTPSPEFLEKVPRAVSGAEKCRKYHEDSDGDGNPSTYVDLLVRSLNGATRRHLQFRL
jgi:RloB-like protein